MSNNDDDEMRFKVVRNQELQYSIWPSSHQLPAGWEAEGVEGSKEVCLVHIEKVWIDMRPLSLRRSMESRLAGS